MSDFEREEWRKWQPLDLLDESSSAEDDIVVPTGRTPQGEESQMELAQFRQQAEQKGYLQGEARGLEEGKKRGYQDGFIQGQKEAMEQRLEAFNEKQNEIVECFSRLLREFKTSLDNLDSIIPLRLVQLSLTAARSIIGKNIICDNTVLLEEIRQLLAQDALLNSRAQLWVNPDEFSLIKEHIGETLDSVGWVLCSDEKVLPGGCRITSEEVEFDATVEARWQALCHISREDYA